MRNDWIRTQLRKLNVDNSILVMFELRCLINWQAIYLIRNVRLEGKTFSSRWKINLRRLRKTFTSPWKRIQFFNVVESGDFFEIGCHLVISHSTLFYLTQGSYRLSSLMLIPSIFLPCFSVVIVPEKLLTNFNFSTPCSGIILFFFMSGWMRAIGALIVDS